MGALSVFIFVLGAFIVIGYIYLAGVVGDAASKSKRNSSWWYLFVFNPYPSCYAYSIDSG